MNWFLRWSAFPQIWSRLECNRIIQTILFFRNRHYECWYLLNFWLSLRSICLRRKYLKWWLKSINYLKLFKSTIHCRNWKFFVVSRISFQLSISGKWSFQTSFGIQYCWIFHSWKRKLFFYRKQIEEKLTSHHFLHNGKSDKKYENCFLRDKFYNLKSFEIVRSTSTGT
jgi:hypothetical protein